MHLHRESDDIVADQCSALTPTYGAEAGGVLETVMHVTERPAAAHNEFVEKLNEYMGLVDEGNGRGERAKALRAKLESLSARDPALDRADMEMERQEVFKSLGEDS